MSTPENFLKQARSNPQITNLPPEAARGAEAYFQAYDWVTFNNPKKRPARLRSMATEYLSMTASPPLTNPEKQAANLAREILKQLN